MANHFGLNQPHPKKAERSISEDQREEQLDEDSGPADLADDEGLDDEEQRDRRIQPLSGAPDEPGRVVRIDSWVDRKSGSTESPIRKRNR